MIIVSTRDREPDVVNALDAGADDYVTRPFSPRELLARIRAAVRSARRSRAAPVGQPILDVGPIRIDRSGYEVMRDGELVHLTPLEFQILVVLVLHAGRVVSHAQLTAEVWATRGPPVSSCLRVHVAALRRKLEDDPPHPRWLLTEPGVGYRVRDPGANGGGRAR